MEYSPNWSSIARRIVNDCLKIRSGETALIHIDVAAYPALTEQVRYEIARTGAIDIAVLLYDSTTLSNERRPTQKEEEAFDQLLNLADVYMMLPQKGAMRPGIHHAVRERLQPDTNARGMHFHWTSFVEGIASKEGMDIRMIEKIYEEALDIDYPALKRTHAELIKILTESEIRVTSPGGTDLTFRMSDRPFSSQNGDASPEAAANARVLVDKEQELPAGALRAAPDEDSCNGILVIPRQWFDGGLIRNLSLTFSKGNVKEVKAQENAEVFQRALSKQTGDADKFREFAVGCNPKLPTRIEGSDVLPYYGYGSGAVRISIGDNSEIGGKNRASWLQWFFLTDATVEVNGARIISDGNLMVQ